MQLPGENGFHARDGSLTKKKREQWEKEKAESSWSLFGLRSSSGKKVIRQIREEPENDLLDIQEQNVNGQQQSDGKTVQPSSNNINQQHQKIPAVHPPELFTNTSFLNDSSTSATTIPNPQQRQMQQIAASTNVSDDISVTSTAFKYPSTSISVPSAAFTPQFVGTTPSSTATILSPLLLEYPLLGANSQPHPLYSLPNFIPTAAYPASCLPMPINVGGPSTTFMDPFFLPQKVPPSFTILPTPPYSGSSSSASASSPPKDITAVNLPKEVFGFAHSQQEHQENEADEQHWQHLKQQQQRRWQAELDQQLEEKRMAEQMEARRRMEEENRLEREELEQKRREEEQRVAELRKRTEKLEIRDQQEQVCLDGIQRAQKEAELLKRAKLFRHILLNDDNQADMQTAKSVLKTQDEEMLGTVLKQLRHLERERRLSSVDAGAGTPPGSANRNGNKSTLKQHQNQSTSTATASPSTVAKISQNATELNEKGSARRQKDGTFCRANSLNVKHSRTIANMTHLPMPIRSKPLSKVSATNDAANELKIEGIAPKMNTTTRAVETRIGHHQPEGTPRPNCPSEVGSAKEMAKNRDAPEERKCPATSKSISTAKHSPGPGLFEPVPLRRNRPGSLRSSRMMTLPNGQGQRQAQIHGAELFPSCGSTCDSNSGIENDQRSKNGGTGNVDSPAGVESGYAEKRGAENGDCPLPGADYPNRRQPPFCLVSGDSSQHRQQQQPQKNAENCNSIPGPGSSSMESASVLKFRALLQSPPESQDLAIVLTPSRATSCPTRGGAFLVPPSPFSARRKVSEASKDSFGDDFLRRSLRSPTMRRLQDSLQSLATIDGSTAPDDAAESRSSTPKPFNCRNSHYRSFNMRRETARQKQILENLAAVRAQLKSSQANLERAMSKQNVADNEADVQL